MWLLNLLQWWIAVWPTVAWPFSFPHAFTPRSQCFSYFRFYILHFCLLIPHFMLQTKKKHVHIHLSALHRLLHLMHLERLCTLSQCPFNRCLTHSVNMHDHLHFSTLNLAHTHTHIYIFKKMWLLQVVFFFLHPSPPPPPLCVCAHSLSIFLPTCHSCLPTPFLCVTPSILIYDAMKQNVRVNFFL